MGTISGNMGADGKIILLDPTTYETDFVFDQSAGSYELTNLLNEERIVVAVSDNGGVAGYTGVNPIYGTVHYGTISGSGLTSVEITSDSTAFYLEESGEYTFTPTHSFQATCKLWGASGGGYYGGAGGFQKGDYTFEKGQQYTFWVAGAGKFPASAASGVEGGFGGGGLSGRPNTSNYTHSRGSGGGLTGLFAGTAIQTNSILIAGGGGGGVYNNPYSGGPAGGLEGGIGTWSRAGGGGTQTAGGAQGSDAYQAGAVDGGALYGGDAASSLTQVYSGAGGGSGYFGGGGGGGNNYAGGPGGGGSSYAHSTLVTNSETLSVGTSSDVAPNSTDDDYKNNAARPGLVDYSDGNDGLFVIKML